MTDEQQKIALGLREQLRHALAQLAAPPDIVIERMPDFVPPAVEVVDDLDIALTILDQALQSGTVTAEQAARSRALLEQCDDACKRMGEEDFFTIDIYRHAPEWESLRRQARQLLEEWSWSTTLDWLPPLEPGD